MSVKGSIDVRVGCKATSKLMQLIDNAKNKLLIISPWLSQNNVEAALERQENGVDVRILTTVSVEDPKPHLRALKELIKRKQRVKKEKNPRLEVIGITLACLGLLGLIFLPLTGYLTMLSLLITSGAAVTGGIIYKVGREILEDYWTPKVTSLRIFNSNPLLHAKVYLIDDILAIGSPNFTYSGFNKNIEAVAFLKTNEEFIRDYLKKISATIKESALTTIPLEEVWKVAQSIREKEYE